jgi:hypothetical protein
VSEASLQASLFESVPDLPDGMGYAPELISPPEERALLEKLPALPFKEFEFHGFLGRRRTVSFGWHYDFNGGGLTQAGELPDFLAPLRRRAAEFASLRPFAACAMHLPPAPQDRLRLGAPFPDGGAAVGLSAARRIAYAVGAQHSTARDTALLRHVSNLARGGPCWARCIHSTR